MMPFSIPETYGALILGALIASSLFGVTTIQAIIYFRLFPKDSKSLKSLVAFVWTIDATHTAFAWYGMWYYFIEFYGDLTKINLATVSIIGFTFTTLVQNFTVHCFYVLRIFRLSNRSYWLAGLIFVLSVSRCVASIVSVSVLIALKTFSEVAIKYNFLLPIGLIIAATVDMLIMVSMFILLRHGAHNSRSLKNVVDKLILYTFEVASLTAIASLVCMITYFTIPRTFIFLGIYLSVPKLYANSLIASLNARHHLRNLDKCHVHQVSTGAAARVADSGAQTKSNQMDVFTSIHFEESLTTEEKAAQYGDVASSSTASKPSEGMD